MTAEIPTLKPDTAGDEEWEVNVIRLKNFLEREVEEGEAISRDKNRFATQALADIEQGNFETVAPYLDERIKELELQLNDPKNDEIQREAIRIQLSDLKDMKASLQRE